jgi:hypothetical protein
MLVNFFIVGTQKAGTTALDSHLRLHRRLQMASIKEVHFFDDDGLDWSAPDYTRLHQHFDWDQPNVSIRGEATPIYTYWPHALHRLHRYNPHAKLVMGLRHPSFRAYSHWRMEARRGCDPLTFSDAIRERGRLRVAKAPGAAHRIFSYVERGYYALQIEQIYSLFPRDQVLFYRTDHLWNEPHAVVDQVGRFLNLEGRPDVERRYVTPVFAWETAGMSVENRRLLDGLYTDEIDRTARLSGLNLSDWQDPAYDEPMRPD